MSPRAERFVSDTLRPAYALALRLTGNAPDAWDLTQDSMAKAIRALPGFRGESSWTTWMHRIVVNTWKDRVGSRRAAFRARMLPLDDLPLAEASTPETEFEHGQARERLKTALGELAPEERAVLIRRELDGFSYEEISRELRIPAGTVKSRLFRARRHLRLLLEAAMIAALLLGLLGLSIFRPHIEKTARRVMSQLGIIDAPAPPGR
jgi:RNA polymerase sigma-70 factor (ECF subfamily)